MPDDTGGLPLPEHVEPRDIALAMQAADLALESLDRARLAALG